MARFTYEAGLDALASVTAAGHHLQATENLARTLGMAHADIEKLTAARVMLGRVKQAVADNSAPAPAPAPDTTN